ncbi:MFS transporter-like protein 2 [Elsinoe australis]|uniref:MFS transporter-like protein 2 n=1 Tax=Elsinoe australis TaxID=40998 RepID=A0A4U7B7I1_9PEZI|nr:MFS transporter-like protein 2 [Elsinoe australis]
MYRILPRFTATTYQAATYLFGIALFSISFLVFLNSSISFVITDVIGQKSGVGNAVGTLGFADELVALVACPLWGILSDRVGVMPVATAGYLVIGLSLICLVQSSHVYPDLIIWRMVFSVGGAACTTMVTAVLPTMTAKRHDEDENTQGQGNGRPGNERSTSAGNANRHSLAPSVSSELTITPARFETRRSKNTPLLAKYRHRRRSVPNIEMGEEEKPDPGMDASRLAGFVGMFTGIGALVALGVFLPLPTMLGKGIAKAQAVQNSFYVVGAVSICVAIFVAVGLRGLPGEHGKGLKHLFIFGPSSDRKEQQTEEGLPVAAPATPSYWDLVKSAIVLGFTDSNIGLGYIGGFVARASSVGVSLFIPLFVNAYFIRQGICTEEPGEEIKENCSKAYKLASMLTGISQLVALLSAPLFGWFNARYAKQKHLRRLPLTVAAASGVVGYIAFGILESPDPKAKGGHSAIIAVILIGISQIGAIVCSLGILAQGIQTTTRSDVPARSTLEVQPSINGNGDAVLTEGSSEPQTEATPLLVDQTQKPEPKESDRTHLKGTIAGVYSLAGGAAILLLTKLGGRLFDTTSVGAPFYLLAGFNAALLVVVLAIQGGTVVKEAAKGSETNESHEESGIDRRDHSTAEPS